MAKDYYQTLGVGRQASQEEIKKAFHCMAHQHHPDKTGGNADRFKEINEAYQVLSNPQKRSQYDQFGATFANGSNGFGGFGQQWQTGGFNINMDDLGDLFSNLGGFGDIFGFGRSQRRSQKVKRGRDIEVILPLSFEEAVFGANKEIKLNKQTVCSHCQGSGAEPGSEIKTCPTCQGSGRVSQMQRTILGSMRVQTICSACQGEGQIITKPCHHCQGQGAIKEMTTLTVKIPSGIDDGETIKLSGQGEAPSSTSWRIGTGHLKGGTVGDLYLKISVKPSREFQRQGYDILSTAVLNLSQAVLGDKIEVKTIDGLVDLKIPAGTRSGQIFVLKNKGVIKLHSRNPFGSTQGRQGDHLLTVETAIPKNLTRRQKKLLEELREEGL